MTLHQYFQLRNHLPDPKGSASSVIPSQAVAQANQEVVDATQSKTRERGPYQQYTAKERAKIGKYAYNNGVSTAAHEFLLKLGVRLNESMAVDPVAV